MQKNYKIIGLMSGTSLDGLDIALCDFIEENGKWQYAIEKAECIPYSAEWQKRLHEAPQLSGYELSLLDREYGFYLAECVNDFLKGMDTKPDFISSHGHTVFHEPAKKLSLQIGNGACIAAATGLDTVCDFRSQDVALGGQGAPLVPIGDALLFGEYDFCLNLGGIANISFEKSGQRLAYDICGCNLLLNPLAQELGFEYDKDGLIAASGNPDISLIEKIHTWPYHAQPAPKSLDKERMYKDLWPIIYSSPISISDKLASITKYIGDSILTELLQLRENDAAKVLVTGGGALNKELIRYLSLDKNLDIILPDNQIIHFKEALIFAFLGLLRVLGRINSLASVTGAERDGCSGVVYMGEE